MPSAAPPLEARLARLIDAFRDKLDDARAACPGINWYTYDIFGNLENIQPLLSRVNMSLPDLLSHGDVADIGCSDGDLAYFLEMLGARVTAIDHPSTNRNQMKAVCALRDALGSSVDIRAVDLEQPFDLGQPYGLACLLGVLYHLRNPFVVLEALSRQARFCLLSTRIAEFLPDGKTRIGSAPVAYLVDADELNADATNYWIFSEGGLRRLLTRSRWRLLGMVRLGCTEASDPVRPDRDERAFCLLESRAGVILGASADEGWHALEFGRWRWTDRRFSAKLYRGSTGAADLVLRVHIPAELLQRSGPPTLTGEFDGTPLPSRTFDQPGDAEYRVPVRVRSVPATVRFALDRALPPDDADPRTRGIIVTELGLSD